MHPDTEPSANEDDDYYVEAIGFDDPKRGYYVEYEIIPRTPENVERHH